MSGGTYLSDHAMAIAVINAQQTEIERLREALFDATANLVAAASAYRKYACRSRSVGQGRADPFFTTRLSDLDKAAHRAQTAVRSFTTNI